VINVTALSGMTTQGEGQLTTYVQVCAETLGVELDHVAVRMGDTQLVPFGRGAFVSREAIFGANAVFGAANILRHKLNPVIVDGQIVGGAADGIGCALFSELVYDRAGQLLTGSLADYLIATAPDVPRIRLVHMDHVHRPIHWECGTSARGGNPVARPLSMLWHGQLTLMLLDSKFRCPRTAASAFLTASSNINFLI
jgi:CO/xanthine dehydrogenase Mo-binding subunit